MIELSRLSPPLTVAAAAVLAGAAVLETPTEEGLGS
jgi:hypothetical protein